MNTKLNTSDYWLLFVFYSLSIIIEAYHYYTLDIKLAVYFIDFSVKLICSLSLLYIFKFILIPSLIIKNKRYLLFLIISLVSLMVFGLIVSITEFLSDGENWSEYLKRFNILGQGLNVGLKLVALPLGVLQTKKFYEGQIQLTKTKQQKKENELNFYVHK